MGPFRVPNLGEKPYHYAACLNLKDKHKAFPVSMQFTRSGGTDLQQINLFTTLMSTENVVPANQIALKARFDFLQSAETWVQAG